MKCEHFCNYHCCTDDCPNIQCDMADERWGNGIADDMGLERVTCGQCDYNDKRCGCDDCYFKGGKDCPENECNGGNEKPKYAIGRPIGGISLNGLEYVIDSNNEPLFFDSQEDAIEFLIARGYTKDTFEAEGIIIAEIDSETDGGAEHETD